MFWPTVQYSNAPCAQPLIASWLCAEAGFGCAPTVPLRALAELSPVRPVDGGHVAVVRHDAGLPAAGKVDRGRAAEAERARLVLQREINGVAV